MTVYDILAATDMARAGTVATPRPTKTVVCDRLRSTNFSADALVVLNRITAAADADVVGHRQQVITRA